MMELKIKMLSSFKDKAVGLLTAKKAYPVLLKTRFGIHTFGMKFPIDVLVLDNNTVVKLAENLKPNKILIWSPRYDTVIELPAGEIKEKGIKTGDILKLYLQ